MTLDNSLGIDDALFLVESLTEGLPALHRQRLVAALRAAAQIRHCRICGCSECDPCGGGCSWVEEDLCSACKAAGDSPLGAATQVEPLLASGAPQDAIDALLNLEVSLAELMREARRTAANWVAWESANAAVLRCRLLGKEPNGADVVASYASSWVDKQSRRALDRIVTHHAEVTDRARLAVVKLWAASEKQKREAP